MLCRVLVLFPQVFPIVLRRDRCGIAMGLLWYCCGNDVGYPWVIAMISCGIAGDCCDIALARLWDSYDCWVDCLLWGCFGIAMIFVWDSCDCYEIAVGVL